MLSKNVKHWILVRFVPMAEILGYIVALGVIGFAIFTVFVKVDIVLPVSGDLGPKGTTISLDTDAVVYKAAAKTGDTVTEGETIATATITPASMARVRAARALEVAAELAPETALYDADDLAARLRVLSERVNSITGIVPVSALANGTIQYHIAETDLDVLPADEALATIHDLDNMTMEVAIPERKKDAVEVGMVARVTVPGTEEVTVEGTVTKVMADEDGAVSAILTFSNADSVLKETYLGRLEDGDSVLSESTSGSIVTGQQTLFTKLFSKKQ